MNETRLRTPDGIVHLLYDRWDMFVKIACEDGARLIGGNGSTPLLDDDHAVTCLECLAASDEDAVLVTTCGNCGHEYPDPDGDANCPTCYP